MFLVVHASVGALVGNAVDNPVLAFPLSFALHFLFDMIPHGDLVLYEGYKRGDGIKKAITHTLLDAIVTILVLILIFFARSFVSEISVVAGVIGGLLPDLLVGLYELTRPKGIRWSGRQLTKFNDLHMRNHVFLIRKLFRTDVSSPFGYILQVVVIAVILKIIL